MGIVRCCGITTCLLCVLQPSMCPSSYIIYGNCMCPLFPPPWSVHFCPSTPVSFPLVTFRPFLVSVRLLMFSPSVLSLFGYSNHEEIIIYMVNNIPCSSCEAAPHGWAVPAVGVEFARAALLPGNSMMSQWCLCPRERMGMLRGAAVILVRWTLNNLTASGKMESRPKVLCVSFYFGVSTEQFHEQHYGY